jgi:hypothetical protein
MTKFGKPQLKHVPYDASMTVVMEEELVVAVAPVGTECLVARSMPVKATC